MTMYAVLKCLALQLCVLFIAAQGQGQIHLPFQFGEVATTADFDPDTQNGPLGQQAAEVERAVSAPLNNLNRRQTTTTSNTPPFNPLASDNIATYIGHTPGNYGSPLSQLCNDININIVIIAFVRSFNGLNQLPTFDIDPSCDSRKITNYSAPFACKATYAQQVATCQAQGKKVLLSVGGSSSNTTFISAQDAMDRATTLWNVFGAGTGTPTIRPLGANISVDGFDIDQEGSGSTAYFDVFAAALRQLYATNTAKQFYLSAAPLCANTTSVLPNGFYQNAHFVWARFYNAKVCNVGTKGFVPSMQAWRNYFNYITSSSQLSASGTASSNAGGLFPRLYIGALSFDNANSGYVTPDDFPTYVQQGANATSDRFGGVMLWDGTNGEVPIANETSASGGSENYVSITKRAICTSPVSTMTAGAFLSRMWTMLAG